MSMAFIDYDRQEYDRKKTTVEPFNCVGEFSIGNYDPEGGVGEGGEFKVNLWDLGAGGCHPHLSVFGDGLGALQETLETIPLEELLVWTPDHETFSRRLLDAGFTDRSDKPLQAPAEATKG